MVLKDAEVCYAFNDGGRVRSDDRCSQGSAVSKASLTFYVARSRYALYSAIIRG